MPAAAARSGLGSQTQNHTIPKGMTLEEYEDMKKRKPVGKKNPEVTEETRKKISARLKEKWKDPAYREQRKQCMPNRRGVPHSDETKARISAAVKEKWNDPAYREKVRDMYWRRRRRRGWGGGWRDGRGRARGGGGGGLITMPGRRVDLDSLCRLSYFCRKWARQVFFFSLPVVGCQYLSYFGRRKPKGSVSRERIAS